MGSTSMRSRAREPERLAASTSTSSAAFAAAATSRELVIPVASVVWEGDQITAVIESEPRVEGPYTSATRHPGDRTIEALVPAARGRMSVAFLTLAASRQRERHADVRLLRSTHDGSSEKGAHDEAHRSHPRHRRRDRRSPVGRAAGGMTTQQKPQFKPQVVVQILKPQPVTHGAPHRGTGELAQVQSAEDLPHPHLVSLIRRRSLRGEGERGRRTGPFLFASEPDFACWSG